MTHIVRMNRTRRTRRRRVGRFARRSCARVIVTHPPMGRTIPAGGVRREVGPDGTVPRRGALFPLAGPLLSSPDAPPAYHRSRAASEALRGGGGRGALACRVGAPRGARLRSDSPPRPDL